MFVGNIGNTGLNSRHFIFNQYNKPISQIAEFVPITSLITNGIFEKVKCIKIDVEGDELSVLRSFSPVMKFLKKATFVVEISRDYLKKAGHSPEEIYKFFSRFSYFPIDNEEVKDLVQYDEIFICK